MVADHIKVVLVDQQNAVLHEVVLVAVPRVGDRVEIPSDTPSIGVVDLVTWRVPNGIFDVPYAFVRLAPLPVVG
jgi:hypothetical protein